MQKRKRALTAVLTAALLLGMWASTAAAASDEVLSAVVPYDTYVYDYDGNAVITPHAYMPSAVIDGEDMGVGSLNSPADMEVDEAGCLYIMDTGYTVDMSTLTNVMEYTAAPAPEEEPAESPADGAEDAAAAEGEPAADDGMSEDAAPAEGAGGGDAGGALDTSGFHGRLIILNPDYTVKRIITTFDNGGKTDGFSYPEGLTVAYDGTIYVADTMHGRIARFDQNGRLIESFGDPQIAYFDADFTYRPTKISVDASNNMFIIASSVTQGIILLDPTGEFSGFVGAQQVSYSVIDYIWKNILSEEARSRMVDFVPTEYNNMKIDEDGFLYATTATIDADDIANAVFTKSKESKYSPVKRLNPTGNDVLIRKGYFSTVGDVAFGYNSLGSPMTSVIEDVALGPNGRYTILDSFHNRIFTYSADGELIYAYSGEGYQAGNSRIPVSITYRGTDLLLLDQGTASVTVFTATEYGKLIDDAYACYKSYDYEKSMDYWRQVLNENANFDIAYDGIGNALMQEERYDEAVDYFRYSNNKDRYSDALGENRASMIEHNLLWLVLAVVVLLYLVVKLFGWIGRRNRAPKYQDKHETFLNRFLYSFYIMIHPYDGFWDVKHEKRGSVQAATALAAFLAAARIFSKFFTNYLFNDAYGTKISVIQEILIVFLPLLLWTLTNWCVTTLADGEGSMKDVYVFTAYALMPMTLFTILNTVLSHVLILDEAMYLTFFSSLGVIWSGYLLFAGNTQTHRYTVGKSLFSIFMAVLGMAIVVFLVLVIFTTYQQIYSFIDSVVKEITYRI